MGESCWSEAIGQDDTFDTLYGFACVYIGVFTQAARQEVTSSGGGDVEIKGVISTRGDRPADLS